MRLIDADKLIEEINKLSLDRQISKDTYQANNLTIYQFLEVIEKSTLISLEVRAEPEYLKN